MDSQCDELVTVDVPWRKKTEKSAKFRVGDKVPDENTFILQIL